MRGAILKSVRVAFVGSAGIPNRYGGFESFVEHCGPTIAAACQEAVVTCYAGLYPDRAEEYAGMQRVFVRVPANGAFAPLHDAIACLRVFRRASHIVVLGVSGGLLFPLIRAACDARGKRLIVNIDGVESRRSKYGAGKRTLLRMLDWLAQRCAHTIVCDNRALLSAVLPGCRSKVAIIEYSGDHVLRRPDIARQPLTALTVCRIEPENNIPVLIAGALGSDVTKYTIVGNWNASEYGRSLRASHCANSRLALLDPVYDSQELSRLRESCAMYLHGHSVGGTNPSLVEMLFYDCRLLCIDVPYNRETAGGCAEYFRSAEHLAALMNSPAPPAVDRAVARRRYSREQIAAKYVTLLDT